MIKVASYTILHYGKSYLPYALRSVKDVVAKNYIFYTAHPSHGHQGSLPPPETKNELLDSLQGLDVTWRETDIWNEGPQRDFAVRTLVNEGADIILNLDYDEIWHPEILEKTIKLVIKKKSARNHLINFIHLWRSFNYCCRDDGWPVRLIDTRFLSGINYIPRELGDIYHFGYAITDEVMRYKLSIHGHKDEIRSNWFEEKWSAWPPVDDCHLTNGRKDNGEGWWNPLPFDKQQLPEVMRDHPWWAEEMIR